MFEKTLTDEYELVHAVGPPCAEVVCLEPVNANHRVIPVSGVAQVVFNIRLVVGELFTPNEGIWKRLIIDVGEGRSEYAGRPVKVLYVTEVAYFGLVHIK